MDGKTVAGKLGKYQILFHLEFFSYKYTAYFNNYTENM